jgi:hypothetical protein
VGAPAPEPTAPGKPAPEALAPPAAPTHRGAPPTVRDTTSERPDQEPTTAAGPGDDVIDTSSGAAVSTTEGAPLGRGHGLRDPSPSAIVPAGVQDAVPFILGVLGPAVTALVALILRVVRCSRTALSGPSFRPLGFPG